MWRFERDDAAGSGTLTILSDPQTAYVTSIGDRPWNVFRDNITDVVVNDGVTNIGYVAFNYCRQLRTVTLSASVTSITDEATASLASGKSSPFKGCPNLEAIIVAEDNTAYSNNNGDGVLYNKDKTTLIFCPRGKTGTLTVPATVETFDNFCFNYPDDYYNARMRLSRIEFARTEAGVISADWPFYGYTGDCVLAAADGMLFQYSPAAVSVLPASEVQGSSIILHAATVWDESRPISQETEHNHPFTNYAISCHKLFTGKLALYY